jgi:hypothetical protein
MNGVRIKKKEGGLGKGSASDLKRALLILLMACFESCSRRELGGTE